ncbi:MAG: aminopeptidase, partial [Lachnospiraceae bacterium]
LQERNQRLYQDIFPAAYEQSYANPCYAASCMGIEYGRLFSCIYAEMRALIVYAYEQNLFDMTIRMELFLEIYHAFCYDRQVEQTQPSYETIRQILYWFVSDYSEPELEVRIAEQVDPGYDFAVKLIMESDLTDYRYLYRYGEYITENEIKTAIHLNEMPEELICKMADTYTEGYQKGFVNGNKDLSVKKTVNIRYSLGFERMVKQAIINFRKMGLEPTIYRAGVSLFTKRGNAKIGYYGAIANRQYEYDHREDEALWLDKTFIHRKAEILQSAYEQARGWASLHAGPACIEVFGEPPFNPAAHQEACSLTKAQQKLAVEYASQSGNIVNTYIPGEERSFTIIAFPIPAIGKEYETIFDEVIRINTLDDKLYEQIQQTIIEVLDTAVSVKIQGNHGNQTDLTVALHTLKHPERETIFENCVADVNIPVGEVFTSPCLKGTTGILHVSHVYLNELEYKDLTLTFEDGMITKYSCANFPTEKENQQYMKDNLLCHHDTLPMGEFAIGTNTTAYQVARKYHIENKLPILIAEKMGPHFAIGDTCYSHSEEIKVYNPTGKEIVAKDNAVSLRRLSEHDKDTAYYNCHTDITIPYDELQAVTAVTGQGEAIPIIQDGLFVLAGCTALNEPLENNS